jgi:hypothetical protein
LRRRMGLRLWRWWSRGGRRRRGIGSRGGRKIAVKEGVAGEALWAVYSDLCMI